MSRRLVLAVFIDGFGWELAQRHAFLDEILADKKPLDTIFGYSSACDPSILTGVMPQEHDHLSFYVYDPQNSPFRHLEILRHLPSVATDRARVRHWLSRIVKKINGFTGYFELYNVPFERLPYLDYTERYDIYRPGGIRGGQQTVFDHLRSAGIPFQVSDWRRSEDQNFEALHDAVVGGDVQLAWLFLGGLDGVLHMNGTSSPAVGEKIREYERLLRPIIDLARRGYDEVRIHVFSDHGMADVTRTVDVMAAIDRTGLSWGRDYAAVYDSTMARFWFLRSGARGPITSALSELQDGRILSNQELADFGCNFKGERYGELFFLVDPGVLIVPSYMGLRPIPGMHGYDPKDADSIALYATNTRDSVRPRGLTDLFGLVLSEVGLG